MLSIQLKVNGTLHAVQIEPAETLLHVLREKLGLTGTKEGCGEGDCGACTILVDGKSVNSCIFPAVQADGCEILTVEGVENDPKLAAIQKAFVDHGAVQCGFCSPGRSELRCRSIGRSPISHPPGDDSTALPVRPSTEPRKTIDERISLIKASGIL